MTPSCKLKLARISAKLKFQDGAECGNNKATLWLYLSGWNWNLPEFQLSVAKIWVQKDFDSKINSEFIKIRAK